MARSRRTRDTAEGAFATAQALVATAAVKGRRRGRGRGVPWAASAVFAASAVTVVVAVSALVVAATVTVAVAVSVVVTASAVAMVAVGSWSPWWQWPPGHAHGHDGNRDGVGGLSLQSRRQQGEAAQSRGDGRVGDPWSLVLPALGASPLPASTAAPTSLGDVWWGGGQDAAE